MFQYLIKRFLLLFVTLFGISVITFLLTRLTPGDPSAMKVAPGGGAGVTKSIAGFDQLVEMNRRNLGLDRPWLFNFRFEDRDAYARLSLYDYVRAEKLWQDIGNGQLNTTSSIALPHALELFEQSASGKLPPVKDSQGKPYNFLPPEDIQKRLMDVMPRLALEAAPPGLSPTEAHAHWKKWYETNKGRYTEENLRKVSDSYLNGQADVSQVRQLGGFIIPYLIVHINDPQKAERVDESLAALTGFNYRQTGTAWERDSERVVERWNSWWRRDRNRLQVIGPFRKGLSVVANTQYGLWFSQLLHLDFGDSYRQNRPVREMIVERLPVSLQLSLSSILVAYIVSIPIGIFSAVRRYTKSDRLITLILFVLYSLPSFWVATMLILSTTGGPSWPDWFPTRGLNSPRFNESGATFTRSEWLLDRIWHLILPVTVLTYGSLAYISRQMRSSMLEAIKQDYIRTGRAKGLAENVVIFKHALRNSLIPIITISAGLLPDLIAGSVVVEVIFTIPGIGMLTYDAILNRDYPVINAILFISAFLTLLGILLADLLYAVADPRIRYE